MSAALEVSAGETLPSCFSRSPGAGLQVPVSVIGESLTARQTVEKRQAHPKPRPRDLLEPSCPWGPVSIRSTARVSLTSFGCST